MPGCCAHRATGASEATAGSSAWWTVQELVRTKIEVRRNRYGADPRELQRKLADVDGRIQNYYRAIGEGLDPTICREHIAKLEVEKNEIEQEADILRKDAPVPSRPLFGVGLDQPGGPC